MDKENELVLNLATNKKTLVIGTEGELVRTQTFNENIQMKADLLDKVNDIIANIKTTLMERRVFRDYQNRRSALDKQNKLPVKHQLLDDREDINDYKNLLHTGYLKKVHLKDYVETFDYFKYITLILVLVLFSVCFFY